MAMHDTGQIDPVEPVVAADRAGRVESHGIDPVPDQDRHGHPRELFMVWAASNTAFLYIVTGAALVGLGLGPWRAIGIVVAGNLFWVLNGLLAVSGPAAGTPSSIIMRAMFGVRFNRLSLLVIYWGISVCFEAINLSIGASGAFALLQSHGVELSIAMKLVVVLVIAVATFTVSVYGHATIVALSGPLALVLLLCFGALFAYLVPHVHLGLSAPGAHGGTVAATLVGFTLIASGPLSWGTAADYARYLHRDASPLATATWTALGGFVPCVLLGVIGVAAATAVDMSDALAAFAGILPASFYAVLTIMIVLGSMTNNVLTAYSAGLALLALGVRAKRTTTVVFDAVIGVALTVYALFVSTFIETMQDILTLSVALLGPNLALYGADIVLRRNRYDGAALADDTRASRYWFAGGVNPAGAAAQTLGSAAAFACVQTPVYVGPVARALGGADVSCLVGPVVAVVIYSAWPRGTTSHGGTLP